MDALIGATAIANGLNVVTRTKDSPGCLASTSHWSDLGQERHHEARDGVLGGLGVNGETGVACGLARDRAYRDDLKRGKFRSVLGSDQRHEARHR
jgi:hypothetical protein